MSLRRSKLKQHKEQRRHQTQVSFTPMVTGSHGNFKIVVKGANYGTHGDTYLFTSKFHNLPEPLLGTLILGTSEPSEPYLEPLLGTLTWNLGTCRNLDLEPSYLNPYSESRNLPEPLLGTLTWNLGARRNLYLEPLLGTSNLPEPLLGTLTWNLGTA